MLRGSFLGCNRSTIFCRRPQIDDRYDTLMRESRDTIDCRLSAAAQFAIHLLEVPNAFRRKRAWRR